MSRPDQAVQGPKAVQIPYRSALPQPIPVQQVTPFELRRVEVSGSSLADLQSAWRPFVGRLVGKGDLAALADAIVKTYKASDIALYTVLIPTQDFANGVVRVRVLEGYIEDVVIKDGRRHALVEGYARRLKAERPLKRSTLQRYVSLIADIPGLNAKVEVVNGGAGQAVRLVVTPREHQIQVGAAINNRGTAFLGRTQASADLYLNSLVRDGDQTRLTVGSPTDGKRFQYDAVSHLEPLGGDGTTLQVSGGYLRTRPVGTNLLGHATSVGLVVSHPLIRSYTHDLYVTVGLDGLNANNALLGTRFSDERTRAFRAGASFGSRQGTYQFAASGAFSAGIAGFGARPIDPGLSDLDFKKLNFRAALTAQPIPAVVLRLNGSLQWTGDRLPASEQFALGGADFGRAYEAAVIAGDYGYGVSAEIAHPFKTVPTSFAGSEVYGFVDTGQLWYRSRLGFPKQEAHVSSAGFGLRVPVGRNLAAQLEAAHALPNHAAYLDRDAWRVIFSLRVLR